MRERRDLGMMRRLAAVQRARRVGAEAAMAAAAQAEREAAEAEREAEARSLSARLDWSEHLARPGFSPEFSRALSSVLIVREGEAGEAARKARSSEDNHAERRGEWQRLEAQVRLSEQSVKGLRRKVARKEDERKMAALADRVTYFWSRP